MSQINIFNLQQYIDKHNCSYYVETGLGTGSNLEYALHSPFNKLFSLDSNSPVVDEARLRFSYNSRVQIFVRTHSGSFYELARMVPIHYPAVFWFNEVDKNGASYWFRDLVDLVKIRPAKRDVLLIGNIPSEDVDIKCDSFNLNRYFSLTHLLRYHSFEKENYFSLVPNRVPLHA